MLQILNRLTATLDRYLRTALANPYFSAGLTLFLVLYASLAAPDLPPFLAGLFDNPLFKLLVLFLILLVRDYDPTVALLAAVAFIISLQALNRHKMFGMALNLGDMICPGDGPVDGPLQIEGEGEGEGAVGEGEMEPEGVPSMNKLASAALVEDDKMDMMDTPLQPEMDFDPYGFMGCDKPLPQTEDPVLPPQPKVPQQVAAVTNTACKYQGPQGMTQPVGFPGKEYGAEFGTCGSEL